VTDELTDKEIETDYELNTGLVIVRRFENLDPMTMPAVLVVNHAPFCWGSSATAAAHNAWMLEEVAQMAMNTLALNPTANRLGDVLRDKHFLRKHGSDAYYGQKKPH
jgi:L-ribulose-5-phosphate 4-epimerase